jgi:hypothetical protein
MPASLLQSCSSVRCVVERNEIYTLVYGKTFFWLSRALFFRQLTRTALCYCWGRHVSFPGARRPDTWNSRHMETSSYTIVSQEGPSCKPSKGWIIRFWVNPNKQHLSFSSLSTTRKVLRAKHQQIRDSAKFPPSLSIITIPPLFFLYLHCNVYEFRMVSMLKTNEFRSSTEIVHKFGMISAYNRPIICQYSVRKDSL